MSSARSPNSPATPSAVAATAKGATFLILIQVLSRALTFIINQVLLRYLSPALLGASTQLELYSISVLYFARESIRVALQRATGDAQALVNVSYISVVAGIPLAGALGTLYAKSSALPDDVPHAGTAIAMYGVAAVVELLTEPCFVLVQQNLAYRVRATAETLAAVARCVVIVIVVIWAHRGAQDLGVLPFGIGQLAFAMTLFLVYYARTVPIAKASETTLVPHTLSSTATSEYVLSLFPPAILSLVGNLTLQSSVKYILTHGAGLIITALTTLQQQGAYALAANYGGLAARMLFQPLEESGRNLFGKLCAPETASNSISTLPASEEDQKPGEASIATPAPTGLAQAATTLTLILRFYALIALAAWSIGPTIAPLGLRLIAGQKWADTGAGNVLATYCYYIPLLAMNGITEAFVAAVATNAQLKRQSALMALWFVAFAATSYVLLKIMGLGAQGLVLADCLNMALRIVWNVSFIKNYFAEHGRKFTVSSTLPSTSSLAVAVSTAAATIMIRDRQPASIIGEIIEKFGLAACFAALIVILEKDFFVECYGVFKRRG